MEYHQPVVNRYRWDKELNNCVEDPNGGMVVKVYRPILTPEEERKVLDNMERVWGELLHCKITITKKADDEK